MHWATPEERRALGQARRKQVGRHQHDALGSQGAASLRSGNRRAVHARPRARTHCSQVPAHGRVALRLLSRRSAGHGRGPGPASLHRHRQPALRRRPRAQPGRLRRARRTPRLRHQRLRRDHSRPLRVGPEAHGGLAGAGWPRRWTQRRLRAQGRRGLHRALRRADARFYPHDAAGGEPVPGAPHRSGQAGARRAHQGRARHAAAHAGTTYEPRATQPARFVPRAAPLQGIRTHAHARHRRARRRRARLAWTLPRNAGAAAPASALVLPPRRCGFQSGRHRLRGPARLLHLHGRQRPRRSALFADQGRDCVRLCDRTCPTLTPRRTTASV